MFSRLPQCSPHQVEVFSGAGGLAPAPTTQKGPRTDRSQGHTFESGTRLNRNCILFFNRNCILFFDRNCIFSFNLLRELDTLPLMPGADVPRRTRIQGS